MPIVAGIDIDQIGVGKTDHDQAENIMNTLNKVAAGVFRLATAKMANASSEDRDLMERVKRGFNLLRDYTPYWALARSYKNIIAHQQAIINQDVDQIISKDYSSFIKKDERTEMMQGIINLIKKEAHKMTKEEMSDIWDHMFVALICSIKFKEHIERTGIEYGQSYTG